ncbi:AraC family transcriptional regulator [Lampropedia aestuarii]|uniref:AraC family transcriptional regulator n=1 Tax=Lampropedia aestuarii TaxID=2562762 RepID=A0A4S5BNM2_9BURK|nr:AraC family transcriptional regulator [Lampropedia aestuarii]MDH5856318.1 AraC family transcriptional regulator [Lampropedia aestuarii]THJ34274.1 AraC family transcriptional regulator [Lampropedia aestuarii]
MQNAPETLRKTTNREPARATPLDFLHTILRCYARLGKDPKKALEYAQITPKDLQNSQGLMTALQMERLSLYAMQELDDEALGWLNRPMRWGSYGFLARATLTAPNLRVALLRWCRHHGLLTDELRLQLQAAGSQAVVTVEELTLADVDRRRLGLLTLLRNIHGFSCWLLDSQIRLTQIELPFEAPPYAAQVSVMFPTVIRYGAPRASLQFDVNYLEMPVRRDEAALNLMLQRALLVVIKPYRRDRLMQQRVRQLLANAQEGQSYTAETIAQALHVSVRSLHRFLQEDGVSLQKIKDEVHCEKAKQLLMRTSHPIKRIAACVGFDNAKSFTRAFTRWVGVAPSEYRESGQAGVSTLHTRAGNSLVV